MRLFAAAINLVIDLDPLRAAWAHALAMVAIANRGVETVTSGPTSFESRTPEYPHRLNNLDSIRSIPVGGGWLGNG